MDGSHWSLSPEERRGWREDGFFIRLSVFAEPELHELRAAAERAVERARDTTRGGDSYRIDGNRYVEADGTTVQFEHARDSQTIRVLEPFHHLDGHFEDLIDDSRIAQPMRELVGSSRISLFTDKLNLKRPLGGSRFR